MFFTDYDKEENCWFEEFDYKKEELIQAICNFKSYINKKIIFEEHDQDK